MPNSRCPNCSNDIPENAPAGVCPQCLLGEGIFDSRSNAATVAPTGHYAIPSADSLVGRFPNLEIEYLIGQGGMGAVYKARQTNLDRTVALKILSPQLGNDPTFAERFTREARTLAKLSHPNIVTVFDFGFADSMHYLVMEYIDGVNLRDTILATEYSSAEALALIGQICDALQYAHDAGVVHRDIKPENILVDRNGVVKIADFGLAKLLSPTPEEFTLTGTRQVLGTLKYMAPEQIEKPEQVDHRADLYSLGVVFYELLTGELPIGRFAVPSTKAEINRRLDDVVLKTLEKEPDHRYQQASEIKTAVAAAATARAEPLAAEPEIPVATPATPARTRTYAVPFTTDDIYGGMCNGYGIAKFVAPNILRLEVEVQDCFGATKVSHRSVDVPIDQLSSIRLKSGFFRDKITVQADSFAPLSDVPSASRGALNLYTKKADAPLAEQLTIDVHNQLISTTVPVGIASPTAPVKQPWNAEHDSDFADTAKSLRVPLFGLLVVSLLYTLTTIGGGIGRWVRTSDPAVDLASPLETLVKVVGTDQSLIFLQLSCFGAVLTLGTAFLLWRKNNYWLSFGALILCCIPFHPLSVLSFFFGVWGLVALNMPAAQEAFRINRLKTHSPFAWLLVIPVMFLVGILGLAFLYSQARIDQQVEQPVELTNRLAVEPSEVSALAEQSDDSAHGVESAEDESGVTTPTDSHSEATSTATPERLEQTEPDVQSSSERSVQNSRTGTRSLAIGIISIISGLAFLLVVGMIILLLAIGGSRRT